MLLQPEAVAQNIQAFVIPVTGGLLKRFGWCVDQAIGQFPGQILHNGLCVATLFKGGLALWQSIHHESAQIGCGNHELSRWRFARAARP